jgi:hypothetical protein
MHFDICKNMKFICSNQYKYKGKAKSPKKQSPKTSYKTSHTRLEKSLSNMRRVFFNKVGYLLVCCCLVLELLPAGLSGKWKRHLHESTSFPTRWWGILLPRLEVLYMVAMLIARYDVQPERRPLHTLVCWRFFNLLCGDPFRKF